MTEDPSSRRLIVDVTLDAAAWQTAHPDIEGHVARFAQAAYEAAGLPNGAAEVAIVLTDDSAVRHLNATYRKIDRPTNVLAFPAEAEVVTPRPLGDLVLAAETVQREAIEQAKTVADHVAHLVVHGTLHLCGHDHDHTETAVVMEALECRVLAAAGVADPYAVPADDGAVG